MGAGEKQNGREIIDRTTRHLIDKGGLDPKKAQQRAREARIRNEQREDGVRK
ncbi:MAG TPA: hypothetical protein VFV33_18150 [Gemmatimonadaceae bacterium]|nr:hypothetical protein [Gemmatimonadaceae bacterium]